MLTKLGDSLFNSISFCIENINHEPRLRSVCWILSKAESSIEHLTNVSVVVVDCSDELKILFKIGSILRQETISSTQLSSVKTWLLDLQKAIVNNPAFLEEEGIDTK